MKTNYNDVASQIMKSIGKEWTPVEFKAEPKSSYRPRSKKKRRQMIAQRIAAVQSKATGTPITAKSLKDALEAVSKKNKKKVTVAKPTIPKKPTDAVVPKKKEFDIPKIGPRPTIPKKPESLNDAENALNEQLDGSKIRLMNIVADYNMFLTLEDTEKLKELIESAAPEQMQRIWKLMPSDEWKDFYKMLSGKYSSIDTDYIESTLDQIAEVLGMKLNYDY